MMIERFQGCLLGGAIGDALGYPVEFMSYDEIVSRYGKNGVTKLTKNARVSDDTQMTLFTANALLYTTHADDAEAYWAEYQRWLFTQIGYSADNKFLPKRPDERQPFILDQPELFAQRAPGNTCLSALMGGKIGTVAKRVNNSKGCGGVMRVAPCGLRYWRNPREAFYAGMTAAATTHGNSTGFIAAGAFAAVIAMIVRDQADDPGDLRRIILLVMKELPNWCPGMAYGETQGAMREALDRSIYEPTTAVNTSVFGEGWTAASALAIALYCAAGTGSPTTAIRCAVNHDGDSDSTGAICGNIVGALYGVKHIPCLWLDHVELAGYIRMMADDLWEVSGRATP